MLCKHVIYTYFLDPHLPSYDVNPMCKSLYDENTGPCQRAQDLNGAGAGTNGSQRQAKK